MKYLTKGDVLRDSYGEWLFVEVAMGSCLFIMLNDTKMKFRKMRLAEVNSQIENGSFELVDRICNQGEIISVCTEGARRVDNRCHAIAEAMVNYSENLMWLGNTKKRAFFIKEQAQEHKVSCYTVRKFVREFVQNNFSMRGIECKYQKCGAPGNERIFKNNKKPGDQGKSKSFVAKNEDIKIAFDWATDRYEAFGGERSYRAIHDDMVSAFFSVEYSLNGEMRRDPIAAANIPTLRQLVYYIKTHTTKETLYIAARDERDFMNNRRELRSDTIAALDMPSIGAQYEIDAMDTDYELVDRYDDTKSIGTACMYFVTDTYCKMICGYSIGLDTNSWAGCQMALLNMVEDKVEYCKKYGINITHEEWPVSHVIPSAILMDNGSDFISNDCKNFGARNAIRLSYTPSRMPSMKGNIEKKFDQFNKELAGIVPGKRKKIQYNKNNKPVLTIEDMDLIALHFIIEYNQIPIINYKADRSVFEAGIETSPVNIWNLKLGQENGLRKVDNMLQFKFDLLSEARATITPEGILFKGIYYICEKEWLKQKMRDARDGRIPITIRYDKRNMSQIYFVINNEIIMGWINMDKTKNEKYIDCNYYEIATINKREKEIQERGEETARAHRINMHKAIEGVSANAKRKSTGKVSNKNKKENRKIEKERTHVENHVMANENLGPLVGKPQGMIEGRGRTPTRILVESLDISKLSTPEVIKLNEQIKLEEEAGIYVDE